MSKNKYNVFIGARAFIFKNATALVRLIDSLLKDKCFISFLLVALYPYLYR